jgi:hypothetical protein
MTADTANAIQQQLAVGDKMMSNNEYPTKILNNDEDRPSASRSTKKEALMEMIAQEMIKSMMGKDDDDDVVDEDEEDALLKAFQEKLAKKSSRKKVKRRTSIANSKNSTGSGSRTRREKKSFQPQTPQEDVQVDLSTMYYAQMTGQPIPEEELKEYEMKIKDNDADDLNDSFQGGCLDDLVDDAHRSQSSRGNGSHKSTASSGASYTSGSTGSSKGDSMMDVEEIRKFVMSSIPQAVRDQIPEEAWGDIFSPSSKKSKSSRGSKSSRRSMDKAAVSAPPLVDSVAVVTDDEDDISVVSDVTGFTNAFPDGKRVESKLDALADESAEYEIPSLIGSEIGDSSYVESTSLSIMGDGKSSRSVIPEPAAATTATTSQGTIIKKVAFSYVVLRQYERCLSDNPAVQSGPAIGIGWRYKKGGVFDVDEFEQGRGVPRSSDELVLSRPVREKILKDAGYSQKEIADMVRNILKAKNNRRQTVNNLNAQGVEEAVENAKKRVGRLLSFGRSKDILD